MTNPSNWKAEIGGWQIQGQPVLQYDPVSKNQIRNEV
jgi:hypothetical protein